MTDLPEEERRAKLPPELARIRALDQEAHIAAAQRAGLNEAQAVAHAAEHMEERARDEYRAPSDQGHAGGRGQRKASP
jgi:hypothetical protein